MPELAATVFADCAFAGLRVSGELQGLFRACIPLRADRDAFDQRPWSTRRGIVPDGMVMAGLNGGAERDYLLECKFVHWGQTGASPPTRAPTSSTGTGAGRLRAVLRMSRLSTSRKRLGWTRGTVPQCRASIRAALAT